MDDHLHPPNQAFSLIIDSIDSYQLKVFQNGICHQEYFPQNQLNAYENSKAEDSRYF